MKVLFISSGNSFEGISPIIMNQGDSLTDSGIQLDYYTIQGKGAWGYFKNIPAFRRQLENNYSLIHAHYSLSAFVATLAGAKPLVVSLMGSDVRLNYLFRLLIKFFSRYFWRATIVKSIAMKEKLGITNLEVIPNGVDTNRFIPVDKKICQNQLKWKPDITHILFAANPDRLEKNFKLTKAAFEIISENKPNIELHFIKNVPNIQMPLYLNAADVVVLSSLWEGSPNVIKEAMACNRPIVATDVGDIRWLFGNIPGHYISGFSTEEFTNKIKMAIDFSCEHGLTNGRQGILDLGLDSTTVAMKIMEIYKIAAIEK